MKKVTNESVKKSVNQNLKKGMYCAETVVLSITETHGLDSNIFAKAATAFCSGMSGTCGTCGALTGGIMGVSAILGRSDPEESVEKAYGATVHLVKQFETEFGSKNCHELLGCDLGTEEGRERFTEEKLHEKCKVYINKSAEIANDILSKS